MLGQLGLGVFELAQLVLPAVLEAAGDEAIVRLAGVESALGTNRLLSPGARYLQWAGGEYGVSSQSALSQRRAPADKSAGAD